MLEKTFNPNEVEPRIHQKWEDAQAFRAGARPDADPYSIVIPPPNVTGSLHMGHALNNTLQDILCRLERMRGRDVLWQPGTDHAGIATQMVVERQIAAEGSNQDRRSMGRKAFLDRVWAWKEESGGTIINQLKRLGASCDWSRQRFTMDEGLSEAVLKVFVDWYRAGLIYRDKRLVNWDPQLLTAISDLEVEQRDQKGHLWYFNYPVEGEDGRFITVATTRPETMLGDTGVAVHPYDPRYKDLLGKHVILPLVGRRIPIVGDEHADPEQGSGAVKITPAHDFNDFEVGRRHNLEAINIFDQHACLNGAVPEKYQGLERFAARKQIVADLEELGLVEKIDPHAHTIPYGDRSGVVIEPWLTDQWYVKTDDLAAEAMKAVEDGRTVFVPKNWEKTYFEWLRNIQPWCISRQLWWGHQIPAWYGPDGGVFVAQNEGEARALARAHYGKDETLTRDEDVLDTWFSSQLWPFSTLGWPEKTPELDRFYPTDVLVTGFDIIFFWVARMMMSGLYFTGEAPFHTVYIHALVRDEKGQKMSKSKGNVIDPLDLIDQYGADALRFTLAAMAAQGRDVKLSSQRVEGYRNFGTKLWNAARFCEMNQCDPVDGFDPSSVTSTLNRWLVGALGRAATDVTESLDAYRFNDAANAAYHFIWGSFCDWYLELAKPVLQGDDGSARNETRATAGWAMGELLKLLHPFMPFITEELWAQRMGDAAGMLTLALWPQAIPADAAAQAEIDWLIGFISEIRTVRAELGVPAGAKLPLLLKADGIISKRAQDHLDALMRLARVEQLTQIDDAFPAGVVQVPIGDAVIGLPLAGIVDFDKEKARLQKELEKAEKEAKSLRGRLSNERFLAGAAEDVVLETRERLVETEGLQAKLQDALDRLAQAQG